jgi:hypothetical protein
MFFDAVGYVVVLLVEIIHGQVLVATAVADSQKISQRRQSKQGETCIDICTTTIDTRLTLILLSRKQSLSVTSSGRYPFLKIRNPK